MTIIYLVNNYNCHYEIIESVILKYNLVLNLEKKDSDIIYLNCYYENKSFLEYIKNKYPYIILSKCKNYNYMINLSIYDKNYDYLYKNSNNIYYISHDVSDRLEKLSNVYFLTPLAKRNVINTDILPFIQNKKKGKFPVYIIQGNLHYKRRNFSLLLKILEYDFDHKFKIKLIGKGDLPDILTKFKDKIILKNNLNFIDYHKEFLDGYCILPLINKEKYKCYYTKKLTSTINYAKGYNLLCLIDEDLQKIYNLENVKIYKNENDILIKFKETLNNFYFK